jgi:hypothetical protein
MHTQRNTIGWQQEHSKNATTRLDRIRPWRETLWRGTEQKKTIREHGI